MEGSRPGPALSCPVLPSPSLPTVLQDLSLHLPPKSFPRVSRPEEKQKERCLGFWGSWVALDKHWIPQGGVIHSFTPSFNKYLLNAVNKLTSSPSGTLKLKQSSQAGLSLRIPGGRGGIQVSSLITSVSGSSVGTQLL